MRLSTSFFIVISLFLLAGCGSGSGKSGNSGTFTNYGLTKGDIISVQISSPSLDSPWSGDSGTDSSDYQKTMTLKGGETAQLSVVAIDVTCTSFDAGTCTNYELKANWGSGNSGIATVDRTGKVTAQSEGETTITANIILGDGTSVTDTVMVAVLPSPVEGTSWITSNVILPQPMWDHASTVWNGYLYVAGGNSSCNANYQDCGFTNKVYYAKLNEDGTLGGVTSTTSIPKTLRGHSMLAHNGYMYLIGGIIQPYFDTAPYPDPANFETTLNEKVYYAKINPDGSLGSWAVNPNSLPPPAGSIPADKAGLFALSAAVHEVNNGTGYIYVTGGWNVALKKNVRTVLIGPINSTDGTVDPWIHNESSDLPADVYLDGLSKHVAVTASVNEDNYLYVIGGNGGSLGSTGGAQSIHKDIYFAKISSDGIPQDWKRASNVLPVQLIDHAAVITGRYLFVLGGRNLDDSQKDTEGYKEFRNVYYYFINDAGDLSPMKRYADLPSILFHHTAVTDKNNAQLNIYVAGGAAGDTEFEGNRNKGIYFFTGQTP